MILGDLGAEVIKVEPVAGDGTRRLPGAGAGFFRAFNRNKSSLALDIETRQGREALLALIDTADVFIENFRPGRMRQLGLDYAALQARNPRLIYAAHKGFLSGPYGNRLALDEVVQMMAGLAYMTGPPGRPLRAGSSVNDIMGGMFGVIGVLAALRERDRSGRGCEVQAALYENCVLLAAQHMQQFAVTGKIPEPMPGRISAWAVYDVFEFAEGEQMFLAATGDRQWRALCQLLGLGELLADPGLTTNAGRVAQRPRLLGQLAGIFASMPAQALAAQLQAHDIPFALIRQPHELFDDPHLLQSGGLAPLQLEDGGFTSVPLLPFSLAGRRLQPRQPLARVGEHSCRIMKELGYSDSQIAQLCAAGVLNIAAPG
jgi:crotonobetainyl-CoA:carnitine CoA-transferase CaiB-like acyl-CoA transferase